MLACSHQNAFFQLQVAETPSKKCPKYEGQLYNMLQTWVSSSVVSRTQDLSVSLPTKLGVFHHAFLMVACLLPQFQTPQVGRNKPRNKEGRSFLHASHFQREKISPQRPSANVPSCPLWKMTVLPVREVGNEALAHCASRLEGWLSQSQRQRAGCSRRDAGNLILTPSQFKSSPMG